MDHPNGVRRPPDLQLRPRQLPRQNSQPTPHWIEHEEPDSCGRRLRPEAVVSVWNVKKVARNFTVKNMHIECATYDHASTSLVHVKLARGDEELRTTYPSWLGQPTRLSTRRTGIRTAQCLHEPVAIFSEGYPLPPGRKRCVFIAAP